LAVAIIMVAAAATVLVVARLFGMQRINA